MYKSNGLPLTEIKDYVDVRITNIMYGLHTEIVGIKYKKEWITSNNKTRLC